MTMMRTLRTMMTLVRVAVAAASLACAVGVATAGGNPFALTCEEGSYLTGFEGRVGAWIDKVTIYCAKWNDIQLDVSSSMGAKGFAGWSDGGNPGDASCPRGWLIAGPWSTRYTRDDDILVLHSIAFNCRPPPGGEQADLAPVKFGSTFPITVRKGAHDDLFNEFNSECPDGEVATGIEGRSGLYVDSLRILCGPAPKYNNPRVANRKGGDLINAPPPPSANRKGGDIILASGRAQPNTPPPPPSPPMAVTTDDTDVYSRIVVIIDNKQVVTFNRTDDDPSHFLLKGFVAPLLAKEGGWWKLELKDVAFAPGGEGWVASDQLKMK